MEALYCDGCNNTELKIYEIVKEITSNSFGESNTGITKKIKDKIGKLGYEKKYEVASSIHNGEWLYDLVWFKEENEILIDVGLVLESELSDRSVKGLRFDFEKLLLANCEIKVFICMAENNYNSQSVNNVKSILKESFDKFKSNEKNRILLLIWDDFNTGLTYPFILTK